MDGILLRKLEEKDIELFKKWVYREHVAKWYKEPEEWLLEIAKRDTEYCWIQHLIVEKDGVPIGFCQYYDYAYGEETWHGTMNVDNTYSIDYLIGETDYLGCGLGKSIVKHLVEEIREKTDAAKIIVQPEPGNKASRNTLLSAGFLYDKENDVFFKELL